ncbi:reverse transcriptase domain-containing protein [Tanacetum coccineum]
MDGCMEGPQLEEGKNLNTRALGTRRTPQGGTSAPAGQAQEGPSPAFMKENIDALRTMIKELGNQGQEKVTPRKLFNEELGEAGSKNCQMSPLAEEVGGYSSDGSSRSRSRERPQIARKHRKNDSKKKGTSKSHRSVRSEARSRSKSKSAKSKPQSARASRRKSSSDSGYDTASDSGSEDLSMPYRRPKPMPFTSRITHFRYHRRAKLPPNVRVYEGNKDPEDHLSIFSAAAEQEEWPMLTGLKELSSKFLEEFSQQKRYDKDPTKIHGIKRKPNEGLQAFMDHFKAESAHIKGVPPVLRISTFMHGHGHPELAKKLNDKIPKTVDEMWERVRAFIRGETAANTTEAIRSPRWEKNVGKANWLENQNGSRNRNHRRGEGRNMGTCAPYARREGFTPLTKTLKEILAMDNVNFPRPPPMVGMPEKQNMNKFCDYHQDRGHNTNDCYHLKKQIEEVVALRRLAHLVKAIRQGGQKGKGSAKGKEKVINMVRSQGYRKRPYERIEHWMDNAITFPPVPQYQMMNCPVVMEALIEGFRVKRIHVDGGSSLEVMYEHCFRSLSYRTRSRLRESRIPLVGFSGEVSYPMGVVDLEVTMGECGKTRTVIMEFAVVNSPSPYNALLGRTWMRSLGVVASTIHSMMKFPTSNGIATISTTKETLRECRQIEEAQDLSRHVRVMDPSPSQTSSEVANPRPSLAPMETRPRRSGKEPMQLDDTEEGQQLDKGKRSSKHALIHTLRENVDIFAWTPADITGIPRAITEHSLDTYPHIEPRAHKKRSLAPDRKKVVTDEVNEWLNDDLNKACPKDLYPLPEIDWKIELLMGFRYKFFLDAYKGYHQIQMTKKDEEKTAFHTEEGVFYYTKMPFGLKNARATYQRLVDFAFKEQIGVNLEAYVDDMVIKSKTKQDIIKHIEQTFSTLRRINMKLNPKKCSFVMDEGKFLGYVVTSKGIRANPEKAKAVMDMPSPKTLKQMQSLSGKLAALNRFLSKSAERSLPFLDTLKKCTNKKDFKWTKAAEAAFLEMKKLVSELPTLTTPKKGETLMMYLAAANEAFSAVLLTERNGRQMPIHYVSRSLQGAEINYAPMEKLEMALVYAARRLRRYFQAHPIKVITDSPIGQVLNNSGASGRLAKWAVELGAYGITYVPDNPRVEDIPEPLKARGDLTPGLRVWRLYTDGASNNEGSGAGLILIAPDGVEYSYTLRLNFSNSNNDAEYEALLAGLRIAKEMRVRDIHALVDSKLVASQVEGSYEAKGERMIKYQEKVLELVSAFNRFRITHIPRAENRKADALSKLAAVQFDHLSKEVLVEVLNERSVETQEVNMVVEEEGPTWMTPIRDYLEKGKLPEDLVDARTLMEKIGNYTIEDGVLYRKSYLVPLMRCVGPLQANYVIREVHMGSCGMHDGPRHVVAKAMNLGYFWPSMHRDAREVIKVCDDCQAHAAVPRLPKADMISVTSAWPFIKWGMDIVGPSQKDQGGFGILATIVTDNRTQFVNDPFKKWAENLEIKLISTSIYHPQGNGAVERANKSLLRGIKTRLEKGGLAWAEEVPNVLWAHRTMKKTSNGETPFSLTYGTEAVIPAEIRMPTHRTSSMNEETND